MPQDVLMGVLQATGEWVWCPEVVQKTTAYGMLPPLRDEFTKEQISAPQWDQEGQQE